MTQTTQKQQGFTLIELAIVVVVLGALFAIVAQQFNGGFTSASKANAVIEGANKMASSWSTMNQSCGTSLDPAATSNGILASQSKANVIELLRAGSATTGVTTLAANMSGCYNASGVKALARTITNNNSVYSIESANLDTTDPITLSGNILSIKFAAVPATIALPIYQKLVDKSATALPSSGKTTSVVSFTSSTTAPDITFNFSE